MSARVLIVVTSNGVIPQTKKATGYHLAEVSHPYSELREHGITVDFASPQGGKAPVDPESVVLTDASSKMVWESIETRRQLDQTIPLAQIDPAKYQGIFFAGGHGTMWDFADNADIQRITQTIWEKGGVVGAVCHGPAALVHVRLRNGEPLVKGKNLAAFSNDEETAGGNPVPFLLETALIEKGGKYTKAGLWQKHVVVDGRLVTGQNPASARGVGAAMAKLLT